MREALYSGSLGTFRGVRLEANSPGRGVDLARVVFPRLVDVIRLLLGEIAALSATGDPPGDHPDLELVVQLRAAETLRAEVRIRSGDESAIRLALNGTSGLLTLEFDPMLEEPVVLVSQSGSEPVARQTLEPWDPHEAIFSSLLAATGKGGPADPPGPSLHDATRAMELAEATARSLRKGRTVDLHYEPISEEASFKSVMTSTGCLILLALLFILPLSMAGPSLGLKWTLFIPYLIPPVLVIFIVMQVLRLAIRRPGRSDSGTPGAAQSSRANGENSGEDRG